jgi:hypothetical protein
MNLKAEDIQYVIGAEGKPTAVLVDIGFWEQLLDALEEAEDTALVKQTLAALDSAGGNPEKAGFIKWETARTELEALNDTQE